MPYVTPGTPVSNRIVFNSGYIDFGSNRIVQVDNVSLTTDSTTTRLYVLNSIKGQDIVRHSLAVTMEAKIKSYPFEFEQLMYGASASGTPPSVNFVDGQPTIQSPVLTVYDKNNKEYQWQLIGAIIKTSKMTSSQEAYAEWDITIDALDITLIGTA